MTQGQDALYRISPPIPCTVVSPTGNVVARYETHPHLVQVSVLLKFRAVLYGTNAICVVPNPVARDTNLLFLLGKFSLRYVIKGQKVLLINY
jgi:hypothetical protein